MLFQSDRDPLRSRESYPVKAQALDSALRDGGVQCVRRVKWLNRRKSLAAGLVVRAEYDGVEPRPRQTHGNAPGSVTLTVYSVPSSERATVEAVLLECGLSALVAWPEQIPNLPATGRSEPYDFTLSIEDGRLTTSEE
jgi:hypothetical protein